MKIRKITALLLAAIMLFTCMMPAYAAGEVQTSAEAGQTQTLSLIEKIKEFFHNIIERLFSALGMKCPFCKGDTVPVYVEEAVEKYNSGINALKNYEGTVLVKKRDNVTVKTNDIPSVAEKIITTVTESFVGETENTYLFSGGKTADGRELNATVEPMGRLASLDAAGVASAESEALENGGSRIRLTLVPEKSVYDGTAVVEDAVYNMGAVETLNYAAVDLGPIVIYEAETMYIGTVLEAEFDSRGRMVALKTTLPMDIYYTAKVAVISISATSNVDVNTEYSFDYWL